MQLGTCLRILCTRVYILDCTCSTSQSFYVVQLAPVHSDDKQKASAPTYVVFPFLSLKHLPKAVFSSTRHVTHTSSCLDLVKTICKTFISFFLARSLKNRHGLQALFQPKIETKLMMSELHRNAESTIRCLDRHGACACIPNSRFDFYLPSLIFPPSPKKTRPSPDIAPSW